MQMYGANANVWWMLGVLVVDMVAEKGKETE